MNEKTTVNAVELSLVLGITTRHIRRLAEDGFLEKKDGRFNLQDSAQRYIAFKTDARDPDEESTAIDHQKAMAEAKLKEAKAQIEQLKAEELERQMLNAEDVETLTKDLIETIRDELTALPDSITAALEVKEAEGTKPGTAAEAAEIIRDVVFAAMERMADYEFTAAERPGAALWDNAE